MTTTEQDTTVSVVTFSDIELTILNAARSILDREGDYRSGDLAGTARARTCSAVAAQAIFAALNNAMCYSGSAISKEQLHGRS